MVTSTQITLAASSWENTDNKLPSINHFIRALSLSIPKPSSVSFPTWCVGYQEDDSVMQALLKYNITIGSVEALNNNMKENSHHACGYRTVNGFCQTMMLCIVGLDFPILHHEYV
jgi:hypothetical protein